VTLVGCAEKKQDEASPVSARLIGIFTYMADAGLFTDCTTGERFPVAHEGDNAALERAYLASVSEPPEPAMIIVDGKIAERPAVDGEGTRRFLIVERFVKVWPDEKCDKSSVETPLTNTYWKLVEIDGTPVETHEQQREVHMVLETDENKVRGFAGCNQFFGGYETSGNALSFGELASTRTACPYLDEETAFFKALGEVRTFEIFGESMLLTGGGAPVRFKAVYL